MKTSFLALAFASVTLAASSVHVVHESRATVPKGWSHKAALDEDHLLPMRIGLTQSNLNDLHDLLMTVSDPDSKSYGEHWSQKDLTDKFAASDDAVLSVTNWLKEDGGIAHDRISLSPARNWIEFIATVAEAEALFKTKYALYESGNNQHVAAMHYSVPQDIQQHIDLVLPSVHFDRPIAKGKTDNLNLKRAPKLEARDGMVKRAGGLRGSPVPMPLAGVPSAKISATSLATCSHYTTPACLEALYCLPTGHKTCSKSASSIGIVEYSPLSYYSPSDLDTFMHKFVPGSSAKKYQPNVNLIDGAFLNTTEMASKNNAFNFNVHGEANLDVQFAAALVYPNKLDYYQVGREDGLGSFNNFLDAIDKSFCYTDGGDALTPPMNFDDPAFPKKQCGAFKGADVISTSYAYDEVNLSPAYERRQCNEYAKLGLAGKSFFFSSGDDGVAGGSGCLDPAAGTGYDTYSYTSTGGLFAPGFPSTCPYVTSVGATQLRPGASVKSQEVAAQVITGSGFHFSSGGGFSNVFSRPAYQANAVASYLRSNAGTLPPSNLYNTSYSRGYPDISAAGVNYTVFLGETDGSYDLVLGTSASAPTVASIFSLINQELKKYGKPTVGFVNPVLYKHPSTLNDIVAGQNPGCGTNGFTAAHGWDPLTGLGTPNYPKLLSIFKQCSGSNSKNGKGHNTHAKGHKKGQWGKSKGHGHH